MFRKKYITLFSLLLTLCFTGSSIGRTTPEPGLSMKQLKKAQIVRTVNLLRAAHKQPALSFENVFKPESNAGLNKIAGEGGVITGTLSGLSDKLLDSVAVVVWSKDSADSIVTAYFGQVDRNHVYRIENLLPGEYYILALADSYIPKYYDNKTDLSLATPVKVEAGDVVSGIDFYMEKYNSGTGAVSGNVATEKDGKPIPRAYVNVFSTDNPFYYGWVETAEDGSYEVTGLTSGTYFANAWADGFLSEYFQEAADFEHATPIKVTETENVTGIDFTLGTGGQISGRVTDGDGKPLAGIYLQAYSDDYNRIKPDNSDSSIGVTSYGYAVSDGNGFYRIGGLLSGDYLVMAQISDSWYYLTVWYDNVTNIEEATTISVQEEGETTAIDFELVFPNMSGEIYGTVTDAKGIGIEGAFIQAQLPFDLSYDGVQLWAYAYTDQSGHYRIGNLPDGSYLVSAYAQIGWQYVQRYWPDAETPDQADAVVVNSMLDHMQPVDFKLPISLGTAAISGQVLNDSGEPILYASVQLTPAEDNPDPNSYSVWAYAGTDCTGSYSIDRLPAGRYIVHAQHWENMSFGQQWYDHQTSRGEATVVTLNDGEQRKNIDFDLTLRPYYGAIAGKVSGEGSGLPITRAFVEITPLGWDYQQVEPALMRPFTYWPYQTITDEQGNYQLEWLPEGEYLISVYSDGAFEYYENVPVPDLATKVKVTGGNTTQINFGMTPRNEGNGSISGRVSDEWDNNVPPVAVIVARPKVTVLSWPASEKFFNTVTKADGTYQLRGLPAGEYYLFSFASDYIGEYYDNAYDPEEAQTVTVDEQIPISDINFTLTPIMWLCGTEDAENGQRAGGKIYGSITDAKNNKIRDGTVYLLNDSEQPVSYAQSNAEGMYELRSVPPGSYRLKAAHQNYKREYNDGALTFQDAKAISIGSGALEINFVLESRSGTGVDDKPVVPKTIELYGNYPNPFNPTTRIRFGLPADMNVQLRIFNLLGQEVRLLDGGMMSAGLQSINWDGKDGPGHSLPSGVYFYDFTANGQSHGIKKMILLR
jgi:protocatechuate 3,4-dioxygenase beta subunit